MKTKSKIIAGLICLVVIAIVAILIIPRSINIQINGENQVIQTRAWTVAKVLENGGLSINPEDSVTPVLTQNLIGVKTITVELSRPVTIHVLPDNQTYELLTPERDISTLFRLAGLEFSAQDRIELNGNTIPLDQPLPYTGAYNIRIKKAVPITVIDQGQTSTIISSADTLTQALDTAKITINVADRLSLPKDTPLEQPLTVTILRASPLTIQLKEQTLTVKSAAPTVGDALAEAGISLEGLDYSVPADSEPLPSNRKVQVVRVKEEINLTQTPIAFSNEYIKSDQVELDKTEVVQPGEFGLEVTRTRILLEDGQETMRSEETTWIAKQPVTQKVGRGTQVVIRKMDTPQGEIEYWRTVNVYATSYSPCQSGGDRCYYGTSSGLPVQQGVIGVTRAWYNLMVGQRIYVPNYGIGTIADVGGGIAGKYWIDLGYTDADYVAWYSNVTIYFLTPVPANIPWILP